MALMKKLRDAKRKSDEAEQQRRGASAGSGDRLRNKDPSDNIYGDKQAEKEGANQTNSGRGGAHKTSRGGDQRDQFEKLHGKK